MHQTARPQLADNLLLQGKGAGCQWHGGGLYADKETGGGSAGPSEPERGAALQPHSREHCLLVRTANTPLLQGEGAGKHGQCGGV